MLDSYGLLVFLFAQKGHARVLALLERAAEAGQPVWMASPNWAEVRYMVERKAGADRWADVRDKLLGLPVEVVPADRDLAELAGAIKAKHKMSLADCFAAALAITREAELYTGDPEFRSIEKEVQVVWL